MAGNAQHPNPGQLARGLGDIRAAPRDGGELRAIVIRPAANQRAELGECHLSPELGAHGDNWGLGERQTLPDGSPKRDVQTTIMSSRVASLVVGTAVLEITEVPHRGCKKFAERFGAAALRFISTAEIEHLRLRGVYAQVVRAGTVKVRDRIEKLS